MAIQTPKWTEFLQCSICFNQFDQHNKKPISLGCGHTFCELCLSKLPNKTQCPSDQVNVETDISKLPFNYALLQLVGVVVPDGELPPIESVQNNAVQYRASKHCIEKLALFLRPAIGAVNRTGSETSFESSGIPNRSESNLLTRPMLRKLVSLVNCQIAEANGRMKAMRAARSLGERTITELILLHQNTQQVAASLWAAMRKLGCQFLGPAMQEEALKLIVLALEGGEALSRKVLVLFVVQKLKSQFPQASKASVGHAVQLLYRGSCFKIEQKENESSLLQLKEQFRTYDTLRKEHDAQIVQIAIKAGLCIFPDQWSSLLYGDRDHRSHMQSIIDKLQSPASFSQSIQQLTIALQRSGDPSMLCPLQKQFDLLSQIDVSPEAACADWDKLEQAMTSVYSVVQGLVDFLKSQNSRKIKTRMSRGNHTRMKDERFSSGDHCTFVQSEEEVE